MIFRAPKTGPPLRRNTREPHRRSLLLERLVCLFFGCLLIHLAGCGKSGQTALHSTTGVVTLDGAPVPLASVVFSPTNTASGSVATGLTDGSGRFTLSTAGREGAAQGTYNVTVFAQGNARPTGGPLPPSQGPSGDAAGI